MFNCSNSKTTNELLSNRLYIIYRFDFKYLIGEIIFQKLCILVKIRNRIEPAYVILNMKTGDEDVIISPAT